MKYTHDEILRAYFAWSQMQGGRREDQWHIYCDFRDQVALGTNADRYHKLVRTSLEPVDPEDVKDILERVRAL